MMIWTPMQKNNNRSIFEISLTIPNLPITHVILNHWNENIKLSLQNYILLKINYILDSVFNYLKIYIDYVFLQINLVKGGDRY